MEGTEWRPGLHSGSIDWAALAAADVAGGTSGRREPEPRRGTVGTARLLQLSSPLKAGI